MSKLPGELGGEELKAALMAAHRRTIIGRVLSTGKSEGGVAALVCADAQGISARLMPELSGIMESDLTLILGKGKSIAEACLRLKKKAQIISVLDEDGIEKALSQIGSMRRICRRNITIYVTGECDVEKAEEFLGKVFKKIKDIENA